MKKATQWGRASWEERKAASRAKAQELYEVRVARGDLSARDFVYCGHCERVWYRRVRKGYCPGAGCNSGPADLHAYLVLREGDPERFPEVPVPGECYPMYGGKMAFRLGEE